MYLVYRLETQFIKWEPFTQHIAWLNSNVRECLRRIRFGRRPNPQTLKVLSNFLRPYEADEFTAKTIASIEAYLRAFHPLRRVHLL